jgi:hypothetical protein
MRFGYRAGPRHLRALITAKKSYAWERYFCGKIYALIMGQCRPPYIVKIGVFSCHLMTIE